MRLTTKKTEEILVMILGEEGRSLVRYLIGKENISEFDLANKTKKDIKIVRRLLYNLYNHNLVGFTRKKDKQKGWYIYYWTLLPESIKFSYFKMRRDHLERMQHRLEEEQRELFFICPNKCVRLNFDQSADFEFHCPECGELIHQDQKKDMIKSLQKNIVLVQAEIKKLIEQRKVRRKVVTERKKVVKKKVAVKKKVVKKKVVKTTKTSKPKKVVKKKLVVKKKVVKKPAKKIVKKK
ncbi:hypothetical protein HOL21_01435 [Candidatus Woesearchaeota archaeon]|jgi:transcription initiation factor TFIIE subunit alpha|nr:hypothetical protein [Candidatus Woesearchaeota archaeon]MBT5396854.1 hypothetical protein [Candidatus Woesearchaeota archaeon]MBT6367742.1 hypothetical protein [Candidatus Woesearchaeota archaeon]MBT7762857.1 hypothetical protein [Candidatus Woesearchaeota archaeon]